MSFCKVCESPLRDEIDRHFSQREPSRVISRWLTDIGKPISHTTLDKHRAHAIDPALAALEVSTPQGPQLPTIRVSSTDFLEAVVNQGAKVVEQNPDRVKLDHALRAASVLERKKQDGQGGVRMLILALTGHTAPVTIRGEYQELEGGT